MREALHLMQLSKESKVQCGALAVTGLGVALGVLGVALGVLGNKAGGALCCGPCL